MKAIYLLFILLLIASSCKQGQSSENSDKVEGAGKTVIEHQEISKQTKPVIYKTATGKLIELIIDKKSNSLSDFTIVPKDFPNSGDSLRIEDADPLQQARIKDLDGDGFDEFYLVTSSTGSGSYSTIFGFASNQDLSLTPIYVPEISEKDLQSNEAFYGYMGHDSIYFDKGDIYRKFPIYKEGDPNCCPTGGDKTLSYQLKAGEDSWILEIKK